MTRINLLDWRAQRREQRKQRFFGMLVIAGIAGLGIFAAGFLFLSGKINLQNERNAYLKQEIRAVDQKIKEIEELERVKNNLLARMQVIEELQSSRSATVHFFDEIVNTLPEGVTLTSIKQSGGAVELEGAAESNGRVSTYMKNLEASPWFDDPSLIVIKTSEAGNLRRSDFTLRVKNLTKSKKQGAEGDEEEVG